EVATCPRCGTHVRQDTSFGSYVLLFTVIVWLFVLTMWIVVTANEKANDQDYWFWTIFLIVCTSSMLTYLGWAITKARRERERRESQPPESTPPPKKEEDYSSYITESNEGEFRR